METLARWVKAIERKQQAVLYGPPGTGKTFVAEHLARHLSDRDDGFYEVLQFHPAYSYEEFVQGIPPTTRADGQLEYAVLDVYHRLNEDYPPIHALCRLILENIGPSHEIGQHQMLPFIVDMSKLFELFVGEWLTASIDVRYMCQAQQRVQLGDSGDLAFRIDMVVCDTATMQPLCVIVTKYKIPDRPSQADIFQAVTYATLKDCHDAVLVYPKRLDHPLDEVIGKIRVRSMTFSLDGDLDPEGRRFLEELFGSNRAE